MPRTSHVHLLDTGEGDWGTFPDESSARRAITALLQDINEFAETPMTRQELNIVPAPEWCHQDPHPCDYDQRQTFLSAIRTPPLWTHEYPPESPTLYHVNGKRTARWKLACSMPIDQAMTLWPYTGHPEALPQWRHDLIIADTDLCPCTNRSHRKKGCIIGPQGRKCLICGALYQDYGSGFNRCMPCTDWQDRRERHLADWAAHNANLPGITSQPSLI